MAEDPEDRFDSRARPLVWVDAQLPPALAQWLRAEFRWDAVHLFELDMHTARDSEIFEAARASVHPIVIVTKDDDFRRLAGNHGQPPQVVWLRCGNVSNEELRRTVLEWWPRAARLLEEGEGLVEIRYGEG